MKQKILLTIISGLIFIDIGAQDASELTYRSFSNGVAFVSLLANKTGVKQDTAAPFNTGAVSMVVTTTIDQAGKLIVGGYYGTNATFVRYTTTGSRDTTFNTTGALLVTSLASTSSINKVINAGTGYIATGQSNNNMATVKLTSTGALDTTFNAVGFVVEMVSTGTSIGYDIILNGSTLAIAGFTSPAGTDSPTVMNYNATTGARNPAIGNNGYQQFPELKLAVLYAIQPVGTSRYAAGCRQP